jgi:hypothetical protein
MVNYIPLISFFIAILITILGSIMQYHLNDIKKTPTDEKKEIRIIGLWTTILCSVLLGLQLIGIGVASGFAPGVIQILMRFKVLILFIVIIEIICIIIGSSILQIDNDNTIDDETKGDKLSNLSLGLLIPGILLFCYSGFSALSSK